GGVPGGPAADVLQRLRQVPVVERHVRRDAGGEQGIHEPVVEVQAFGVHRAGAVGDDPGPGYGEPVGPQPDLPHQLHVVGVAVVVVTGDVAGLAAVHLAG